MPGNGNSKAAQRRAKKAAKSLSPSAPAAAAPVETKKHALWDSDEDEDLVKEKLPKKAKKDGKKEKKEKTQEVAVIDLDEDEVGDASDGMEEDGNGDIITNNQEDSSDEVDDQDLDDAAAEDDVELDEDDSDDEDAIVVQSLGMLQNMIDPVSTDEFFKDYFEKKPLLTPAVATKPFEPILTKADIEQFISKQSLVYGADINVTNVIDGLRQTMDLYEDPNEPSVVADSKDVWSNVGSGCSLRLLCPHKHSDPVHKLLSTLEVTFGCMVGANAYLTPMASQGFAPHYDDVDVFICQQEGSKRWRVYEPFAKSETLPRTSSGDYNPEDMPKPHLDTTLNPGDCLYLPRGWVHQAVTTVNTTHSLHLTVSVMQAWSWADFLDHTVQKAVENVAASEKLDLREGLPRNFLNYMGVMHNNDYLLDEVATAKAAGTPMELEPADKVVMAQRTKFRAEMKKKLDRVVKECMSLADFGADEMSKRYMSERLPPALTEEEIKLTNEEDHGAICAESLVRIVRTGIARVVMEDEKCVVYHCNDNQRDHASEIAPMEFEVDDGPAIEQLFKTVSPMWVRVNDLPHPPAEDIDDKIGIVQSLFDEGIIAVMQPTWIQDKMAGNKKK
jgi:lysine-specific demethylase/histidyl-hydroxylase NO66